MPKGHEDMIGDFLCRVLVHTTHELVLVETERDIYSVTRSGFSKWADDRDAISLVHDFRDEEARIEKVRSDGEWTAVRLSNGDHVMVGAGWIDGDGNLSLGVKIVTADEVDTEFDLWLSDDMQELTPERSYYSWK